MKHISIFMVLVPFVLSAQVVPVYEGGTVPFDGYLVPEIRFEEFLKAEATEDLLRKELEFKDYEVKLEQEFCDKKIDVCLDELNKCREVASTPWYARPDVNRWVGIGIGVVITSLAVYGAGQLDGE